MTYPRKQSISVHPRPSADRTIKALSLWQPWASCVAVGSKRIETRSWETLYRGPLLIHAAKKCSRRWMEDVPLHDPLRRALYGIRPDWRNTLPLGALIAVGTLTRCVITSRVPLIERHRPRDNPDDYFWTEDQLGDFSPGRFAWYLDEVREFKQPIPYKGRQGLFNVPYSVVADQLQSISVHPRPSAADPSAPNSRTVHSPTASPQGVA